MENEIIWICDRSGSMSIDGKLQSLIFAIKNAAVSLRDEGTKMYTRMIQFSDHANWLIEDKIDLEQFLDQWDDEIKLEPDQNVAPMELVFLMDTSSSMSDELLTLKRECENFVKRLNLRGLSVAVSIIGVGIGSGKSNTEPFRKKVLGGNIEKAYTIGVVPLDTKEKFFLNLSQLEVGMFGERGCYFGQKSSVKVFKEALNVFTKEQNHKVLVAISDEVGGGDGRAEIINLLRDNMVSCSIIGRQDPINVHSAIANGTGGHFFDINNDRAWEHGFSKKLSSLSRQIAKEKSNGSDMADAINLLVNSLQDQSSEIQDQKHVTVILVSDGKPSSDISTSVELFSSIQENFSISAFAIGIGSDVDTTELAKFVNGERHRIFTAKEPEALGRLVMFAFEKACGKIGINLYDQVDALESIW